MAIELGISDTQPEVDRRRVFLTRLEIVQLQTAVDADLPKYKVSLEYRRYGVDANGRRHYVPSEQDIDIPDFLSRAMTEAAKGDYTMIQALQAIEGAVAAIIADDLDTTATVL